MGLEAFRNEISTRVPRAHPIDDAVPAVPSQSIGQDLSNGIGALRLVTST
jgi:hypothetical protein